MRLLPSEQEQRIEKAIQEFENSGQLRINEPCNCGSQVRHNNGGNYHEEVYLQRDGGRVFVKFDSTCELNAPAEWEEIEDWKTVIEERADWL